MAYSRVVLLEPPANLNTMFQAVERVYHLGQEQPQKVWSLFQEHSIPRWFECNNIIKALPQLAAQLHDLLKPTVVAARSHTADVTADEDNTVEAADPAEAKVIQQAAAETLCCMLGQPASRLGVKDLDDLGLHQRDVARMKARMTPRDTGFFPY